ncbi:hypothetical protein GCM10009530_60100 [Microbispora corallina]|uniref:Carrier domain-containing protein n=1 Tax=Microbispora corallina TaxID=83302 RepID=A0ABQ4FYY4_9ACTN|nr:phosphopantetheine-binding protein [Microbispora corallina]GIH39996.1 hypothetical protein Mco01_29960 [Microbispora corallina]
MESNRLREAALPDIERWVEEIWREILRMPAALENATFFELEGQSISAVRITARIEDELGVPVDLGELFEDPDLRTFARSVAARAASLAEAPEAAAS